MKSMTSIVKKNFLSELRDIDWDFVERPGARGLEDIHWYPARFVGEIPSILIGYFSEPGQLVLDPFCGSGTTLVEALRLGRSAAGVELNPIAAMMSRAKVEYVEPSELRNLTNLFLQSIEASGPLFSNSKAVSNSHLPHSPQNKNWYHEKTLAELSLIRSRIGALEVGPFKTIANVCFSAILRASCSQEKHWGYICDNVMPRKLVYKNAVQLFGTKLRAFTLKKNELTMILQQQFQERDWPPVRVWEADCRVKLAELSDSSVDLIVTSPPYFNVTDYAKSQRLTFLWDEMSPFELVRAKEIGARSKRFNPKSYNQYIEDMTICLEHLVRVLKRGRYMCLVLGQSPNHKSYIRAIRGILKKNGLALVQQIRRNIPQKRSLSPRLFTESILIVRK